MANIVISEKVRKKLLDYLDEHRSPDLISAYMVFLELQHKVKPVVFPPGKRIYRSADEALAKLEKEDKVWRETEIKIGYQKASVDEGTKKIYICPFTGKVFGDNTHPNPQDAIYDWVSKCKENTERIGGLPTKRFYVSEDPEVINEYRSRMKVKEGITKVVYSSVMSGKLFNTKETLLEHFKESYLKPMNLVEVQSQNRFEIDESLVQFLQDNLDETRIAEFVEAVAEYKEFLPYVESWIGGDDEETPSEAEVSESENQ